MYEFQIKTIGDLKYSRLKTLSILRYELNSFGYIYSISDTKKLLDSILDNSMTESFDITFKTCIEKIFNHIEFTWVYLYSTENNFPTNWIAPIGKN